MQMIIVTPVLKLLSDATANDYLQLIGIDSHVSLIKQRVQITPQ